MTDTYYSIFNTDIGWVTLTGTMAGLRSLRFPVKSRHEAIIRLNLEIPQAFEAEHRFSGVIERLREYFSGSKVDFHDVIDLPKATNFQHEVWQAARLIPYGETRSYGWVAGVINRPEAVRAVGQALGRNPLPVIIPCHRVISADGSLGGFTGGLEMKRFLLDIE